MLTNNRQQIAESPIETLLQKLSLSRKEKDIFLTLLRAGKTTAALIAQENSAIPRTSVYDVIKSLKRSELVTSFTEGKKIFFQVQDVENIITTIEDKKREMTDQQNFFREAADFFNQMKSGSAYRPTVRFFEGKQGILTIHRELQNTKKETKTIVNIASVSKIFPRILIEEDNLKDFQIYCILKKDLMVKTKEAEQYLKVAPVNEYHQIKWLPTDVKFQTDTLIWEGHTAILDYSGYPSGVIIDNPAIAKTFEAWFDMIWNSIREEVKL